MTGRRIAIAAVLRLFTGSALAAVVIVLGLATAEAKLQPLPQGLCSSCHTASDLSRHPQIPPQDCIACHAPHSAEAAPRLPQPPAQTCQACHFEYAGIYLRHRQQTEKAVLHSPVAKGDCQDCHGLHDGGRKPELKAQAPALCLDCHRKQTPPAVGSERDHAPYVQGKCLECHDPHAGPGPALLAGKPGELCVSCHAATAREQLLPNQHSPFGQCAECHSGHTSNQPRLLRKEQKQLCYTCHKAKEQIWSGKPYKHPPFQQGVCTTCHSPHASKEIRLVKYEPLQELCFQCHSDKKERFESAESRHPLGMIGKKTGGGPMYCVDCHQPHAGDYSRMRQRDGNMLCYGCHFWPNYFQTPHNEVEGRGGKGACTNCHNPHGTSNTFMLHIDPVTTCQQCHPRHPSLYQHPVGEGRIDPDKQRDLTCASTCHNPHGSGLNKLLRKRQDGLCLTCHTDRGTD